MRGYRTQVLSHPYMPRTLTRTAIIFGHHRPLRRARRVDVDERPWGWASSTSGGFSRRGDGEQAEEREGRELLTFPH